MYALQYVLHSLCGGGYYNMRAPNTTVSNRHVRLWSSDAAGRSPANRSAPCVKFCVCPWLNWFLDPSRSLVQISGSALPGDFVVISLRIAILFFLPIPVLRTAAANHWVHRGQNSLLNNLFSSLFRVRFRPVEASGWIRSLLACFCFIC